MTVLQLIPPVWITVFLLAIIWTAASSVIAPPPIRRIPLIIAGAGAGAAAGQLATDGLALNDPLLGDAHLAGITVGALLVIVVVRRLAA